MPAGTIQVASAITTMSANRMVYADGNVRWRRLFVSGAGAVCWTMALSWFEDRRHGGRVVSPGLVRPRDLETDEPVDHVEDRAQQVEEAVRQVRPGGNTEHSGDVGTTGVPRHQDRCHRAGVLDGA